MSDAREPIFISPEEMEEQRTFMVNVYKWMCMGLFLTAGISYIVASTPQFLQLIVGNKILFYGLICSAI